MSINERLKILIDTFEGGVVSRFAHKVGIAHTTIAGMMPGSRESKPGFEIIEKIIAAYPQLNTDWLVKGEGDMTKAGLNDPIKQSGINNSSNAVNNNNSGFGYNDSKNDDQLQYLRERVRELEQREREYLKEIKELTTSLLLTSRKKT